MIRPLRCALLLPAFLLSAGLAGCASSAPTAVPRCQGACSTHTEGYEWAQRGDYEDPAVCASYDGAFAEGCRDGIEDRNQMRRATRGL